MDNRFNYYIAGLFVVLIFLTIIFVTAILPATTFRPDPTEAATRYTAQEMRGRDVYRREGCVYCHTQFTRYQDREGGEMVAAGDYALETPHLLGTERTGPDLSNIGGKYPDAWHWAHHVQPRAVKPGSIMPSFSYLSDNDMSDLIAYLQTLGRERELAARRGWKVHEDLGGNAEHGAGGGRNSTPITWIEAPQEMRDVWARVSKNVPVDDSAIANSGRGIFMQNCAVCHGVTGRGNGPISASMIKKPANFTRSYYKAFKDSMWYWRVKEGVAGTRMPRWERSLSEQQMAYLVAYLKTLPTDGEEKGKDIETTSYSQLDSPQVMSENYEQISELDTLHHHYGPDAAGETKTARTHSYVYGGGRH